MIQNEKSQKHIFRYPFTSYFTEGHSGFTFSHVKTRTRKRNHLEKNKQAEPIKNNHILFENPPVLFRDTLQSLRILGNSINNETACFYPF